MEIFKKPYEISLWEDELVFVGEGEERFSYYKEVKVATIGSDTMDSPARCLSPKLSQKINGENALTFTMYYRYWDDDAQDFTYNPFNGLMVNERKVKLRLGEPGPDAQWFDFIIKSIQENSESKLFTYTCKDQFANELSKSGFEIELDNELENNMGTVEVLADRILEGSDWKVLPSGKNLKQYKEEPLYEIKAKDDEISPAKTAYQVEDESETLKVNDKWIYVFYSDIVNRKSEVQFLYSEENGADSKPIFEANDDLVIDRKYPNYILKNVTYDEKGLPDFVANLNGVNQISLTTKYRGERLVRQVQTKYDSTIDKYVGVYLKHEVDEDGNWLYDDNKKPIFVKDKEGKDQQYYGYTESEYSTSGAIVNYVANPSSFISTSGWDTDAKQLDYKIHTEKNESTNLYESYLEIDFSGKQGALVRNSGIGGNRTAIGQFTEGEKYVLRIKYKNGTDYANTVPTVKICEYKLDNNGYYITTNFVEDIDTYKIFDFSSMDFPASTNEVDKDGNYNRTDSNYVYMIATCSRSVSNTELTDWDFKVGLFFDFDTVDTIYIEDAQVFKYETYMDEDKNERLCVPGGKLLSEIKTKYVYYKPDKEMTSIKDLKPVYSEYENNPDFEQQYGVEGAEGNEFTKVRSISAKESNRFNLIQELCETFECWPKFTVERDKVTGEIQYDEDYRQRKFVSFHEYVGKENFAGFRYGVNSKSIQRTIDSAAIVSKMIVKDNANEFAPNGFCSIARSSENPTGENFLLNFDHYVRQGLLDFDVVTNDLYVSVGGYLGYYTKLKELNLNRDSMIDRQAGLLIDISNYESAYTTYKTSYDSALEQQLLAVKGFCKLLGREIPPEDFGNSKDDETNPGAYGLDMSDEQLKYWHQWCQYQNVIVQHGELYPKAENNLKAAQNEFNSISTELKNITDKKRELALQFYKKYSRFIQEGSWIKEDYTDPNLYYLDAESTLHTSAQPKVTYNISVIDVTPLASQEGYEDFAHYDFNIGDRTYIEDVEFFGWSLANRSAPYREEVVVSEIAMELDSSEKNQIKVQNYKTQFEDLFQRITASTQQAEYHTGEYARAASVVETNGTISADTLANSFANNSFKLSNARDQSVVWDSSGITTTSLSNPSEMVRIISGGVFLSNDGGQSWKTGITGSGINTSYLTAGQINTNEIYIMNGNNAAFRWDEKGLSAYWANKNNEGQTTSYNINKFVRFDHNGLYGVIGEDSWVPASLDDIQENAPFALTWRGFSLKNDDGSVRISTERDIQVLDNLTERIKIGRLGYQYIIFSGDSFTEGVKYYIPTENGYEETQDKEPQEKTTYYTYELVYGIKISNNEGRSVMETDDKGELWLKERLRVGDETTSTVEIGYLSGIRDGTSYHEIIHAGNNETEKEFIVYEDGYMVATGGSIGTVALDKKGLSVNNITLNDEGLIGKDNAGVEIFKLSNGELILSGNINAAGGTIGGFTIEKGVEENEEYDRLVSSDRGIILDGKNNSIIAETIKLGTGAEIQDYLLLGEAKIQNPINPNNSESSDNRPFIKANDIEIYDSGEIRLGSSTKLFGSGNAEFGKISINGDNSKIYGENFYITPEEAKFSNVTVSGKIRTAIFEQGTIQTVGGMVLIRPTTKIIEVKITEEDKTRKYRLEDTTGFNDGDFCEFINPKAENAPQKGELLEYDNSSIPCKIKKDGDRYQIVTLNEYEFTDKDVPTTGAILINYGNDKKELSNNIGIALNSSNNSAFFEKEAITVFETSIEAKDNKIKKTPKILLGKIDEVNKDIYGGLTGYGLYADNVYLHGALVTELGEKEKYYSGFNGKRPAKLEGSEDSEDSYVLLWAGATSNDGNYDITKAPFRVDSEGNLYASKGTFNGSVISNATIEAAEIVTPIITGNGTEPALKIRDASEGIGFFSRQYIEADTSKGFDKEIEYYEKYLKEEDGKEYYRLTIDKEPEQGKEYYIRPFVKTLSIKDNGLYSQDKEFITLSATGEASYFAKEIKLGNTTIINDKISWSNNHGIQYSNNVFDIGQIDTNTDADISTAIIKMQAKEFMIGPKMRYEPTENGCDLYVL